MLSRGRSLSDTETAPADTFGALGRGLLYLAVFAAVLPRGATQGPALSIFGILSGLAFLIAAWKAPRGRAGGAFWLFFWLVALLAGFVLFQAAQFADNPVENRVWKEVRPLLGIETGAVSVAPYVSAAAVVPLVAPVLVYLSALALFATDRLALRLWKFLGLLAGVFAIFGILQLEFFPSTMLFSEKQFYKDSVTGFFVNRNTAGTLLGVASLVLAAWLMLEVRKIGSSSPLRALLAAHEVPPDRRHRIAALVVLFATVFVALFMTKSRGAFLSTFVAYLAVGPLLWIDGLRKVGRTADNKRPKTRTVRTIALVIAPIVLVALVFGRQPLLRLQQSGVDAARLCTYFSTWQAFVDNWRLGTGFGTFQSVFPAYRDPTCGSIYGVWDRAHSVWLEGLLGLGTVFVPFVLAIYAKLLHVLVLGYRTRLRLRPVVLAGVGIVILLTLHSSLDFSLQIPGMAAYTAAALACITTICLKRA